VERTRRCLYTPALNVGTPGLKAITAVLDPTLLAELRRRGLGIQPATSLEEAVELLKTDEPQVVVVDESLPFAQELTVAVKSDIDGPDRDRLPVISLEGSADGVEVRCLPDLRVPRASAAELVDKAKALVERRARQRRLFDQELILKARTTPDGVEQTGDIMDKLFASCGYTDEEQVRLGHTFREAMGNAAEHGNKNDPARTIHVNFLRSGDRIMFVIKDEGPGFDTKKFLARAEEVSALEHTRSRRANEVRPGGLGVFIMKQTCDGIRFNDSGNAIYLMKFLPGHAPPAGVVG
jgi:anti-sigma regulatory factor (Ser/Thr protein kinase)/CheY-like chemotaxis protein